MSTGLYSVTGAQFYSLRQVLSAVCWPSDLEVPDVPLLDQCGVINVVKRPNEDGLFTLKLALVSELGLYLDSLGVELLFFAGIPGYSILDLTLDTRATEPKILFDASLELRFHPRILRPVSGVEEANRATWSAIRFSAGVEIDLRGRFRFTFNDEVNLARSVVGDTTIQIEAHGVDIDLAGPQPQIAFRDARLFLSEVSGLPNIAFQRVVIDRRGFSGAVSAEWPMPVATDRKSFGASATTVTLLSPDIEFGLRSISVGIDGNNLIGCALSGAVKAPFFDAIVEAELGLDRSGTVSVSLRGTSGGEIAKISQDAFELSARSAGFYHTAEETALTVGGDLVFKDSTIRNLVSKISLERFTVFKRSGGAWGFRLEGGTVQINKSIDLFGVGRADIVEIGLGERSGVRTFTFSGGVHILDGVDAAGWVEGLRVPLEAGAKLEVDGVGLSVVVPDSFAFTGSIVRRREQNREYFQGEIGLFILPVGLEFGAALKVGRSDCRFAFISAYLNLPAPGIPLASLPLYIKGFSGLLGTNVSPDADTIHEYPPLARRSPVGLGDPDKWIDECGSHAIGLGVALATANPKLLNLNATFGFLSPELILLIEGNAFILENPKPGQDPPFRSLMVLDVDEPAALLAISAQGEFIKGVLNLDAVMEVYYGPDPSDPRRTTSYFAIGKVGPYFPVDQPVRATVVKLFPASAYLIIVPGEFATGVAIGIPRKRYSVSFASVEFQAWMEGRGRLAWDPTQFQGELRLAGRIAFRIFKIGFDLSMRAEVLAMSPDWLVSALLEFGVKLKILFKKFEFKGQVDFEWKRRVIPPIEELLRSITLQHAIGSETWTPALSTSDSEASPTELPATTFPEVEPDTFPALEFAFPTKDHSGAPFGQDVAVVSTRRSGDDRFEALLPEGGVMMWRRPIGATAWSEPFSYTVPTATTGVGAQLELDQVLFGAWQADAAPDGTEGATHLHLFMRTPFDFNRFSRMERARSDLMLSHELIGFGAANAATAAALLQGSTAVQDVIEQVAAAPIAASGGSIGRRVQVNGRTVHVPATGLVDIPVYQSRVKSPEELQSYKKPLPYRAAQFASREEQTYPATGAAATTEERCHNFLRTAPGFRGATEVVAVDEEDRAWFTDGQVLIGGYGHFDVNKEPRQLGTCEIVVENSFLKPLRYLDWHCHMAWDAKPRKSLVPTALRQGVLKVAIRPSVRSVTLHYELAGPMKNGRPICGDATWLKGHSVGQRPVTVRRLSRKNVSRERFWTDGAQLPGVPVADWGTQGQITVRAARTRDVFNEIVFDVHTGLRIYSICYTVDHTTELEDSRSRRDAYVDITWPVG